MMEPLAQRLRPRTLDEVCGQRHLLAPGQVFRRTIDRGVIPNMIFYRFHQRYQKRIGRYWHPACRQRNSALSG